MAEQVELITSAKERLNELGVDSHSLDNKTRKQINALERAVQYEIEQRRRAQSEAIKHRLTVSNISKKAGVGRTTIYDNAILKAYVEACQKEDDENSVRHDNARLQQRIDNMKRQIAAMMQRDGKIIVLEAENRQLKERVARMEQLLTMEQHEKMRESVKTQVISFEEYKRQQQPDRHD